jgi:intracellular sulfur oxidation DsrE/DsrF family protein
MNTTHALRARLFGILLLIFFIGESLLLVQRVDAAGPVPFVMQLTRTAENHGHRRALLQIDKVLDDLGEDKIKVVVVAYEDGIHALLEDNKETRQLVGKLGSRGVEFRACRISMRAWGLKDEQFPIEVEFVPAGAPEVIRLQTLGYKYWRP